MSHIAMIAHNMLRLHVMNEDVAPSIPSLIPVNDCVLVKLEEQYGNFGIKEDKYASRTHGIVVSIPEEYVNLAGGTKTQKLINKRVYWEEYKEGARIRKGNELFCFIKIEDIRGFEDV